MNFQAAYAYMKRGYAITLPEWGGYWTWDALEETILLHCRNGDVLEVRDTKDVDYTIQFLFRPDWYIEAEVEDTEHNINLATRQEEDEAEEAELNELVADAIDCGCEDCAQFLVEYDALVAGLGEDDDDDDDDLGSVLVVSFGGARQAYAFPI